MQDAFSRDMFNISDLNNPRYNGHVQSSCGLKTTGGGSVGSLSMGLGSGGTATSGKKDRKGCTKGKIEAIMRNNAVRTKVVMPLNASSTLSTAVKKSSSSSSSNATNHHQQQSVVFIQNHQVASSLGAASRHDLVRLKEEHDDPYTFTESEPQALGIYQAGGSTGSAKIRSAIVSSSVTTIQQNRSTNTIVSGDRIRTVDRSVGVKFIKSQHHPVSSLPASVPVTMHDHGKTGKVSQTVQEAVNRSSRTVPKRKAPSSGSRSNILGTSFQNQGHHVEQGNSKSICHHSQHRRPPQTDRICLQAKRQPRKSVWQRERNAKHELLERIHGVQANIATYNKDLYPLGVEISDSESDEFELERRAVYERHWFSRTDPDVCLSDDQWNKSNRSTHIKSSSTNEAETPRERRVEYARAETRRRLAQTLAGIKSAGEPSAALVKAVVRAARVVPNATALVLGLRGSQTLSSSNKKNRGARFLTTGEKCSYSEGCQNQALPATRHCLRHIMYNVDQRLFSHCTGRLQDNTQCNRPTFDPTHISPLCPLHTSQAQSVVRSSSDSRHSRKKSRMLGMSRNSKRNNKKKKKSSSALSSGSSLHDDGFYSANSHHHHHHHNHHHHHHTSSHSSRSNSGTGQLASTAFTTAATGPNTTNHISYQYSSASHPQQHGQIVQKPDTNPTLQHSVGTDPAMPVSSAAAPSQTDNHHLTTTDVPNVSVENIVGPTDDILIDASLQHRTHPDIVEEVSEEVLAIEALDPVELANQTTRLLEEHDLNNVLNQISTDLAFNDLFTDKNGEYEPTKEETEELERALEAVDNDVRSLERMSRALPSLPLPLLQLPLDGLLDTTPTAGSGTTAGGAAAVTTSTSPNAGGNAVQAASTVADASFDATTVVNGAASTTSAVVGAPFHNGYVSSPVHIASIGNISSPVHIASVGNVSSPVHIASVGNVSSPVHIASVGNISSPISTASVGNVIGGSTTIVSDQLHQTT